MRCTSPRTVGFEPDGTTLCWSPKKYAKEFATFKLPCGKCIECRLDYARQWAVRCVHEAQMHDENAFITLTYDNAHLSSPKLIYSDFQKFMKRLRKLSISPIGVFVAGEYGEQTKRPHWHALIFGWRPKDAIYFRSNDRGDRIFKSETLERLWGKGHCEFGDVTFESAGYCARYAAKKIVHGKDHEHDYHPISKKSSKHAIGKKWLEVYWKDVFNYGKLILRDGTETSIPRYYEKWLKDHHFDDYMIYVTRVKSEKILNSIEKEQKTSDEWVENLNRRLDQGKSFPLTRLQVKAKIQKSKLKTLNSFLKL